MLPQRARSADDLRERPSAALRLRGPRAVALRKGGEVSNCNTAPFPRVLCNLNQPRTRGQASAGRPRDRAQRLSRDLRWRRQTSRHLPLVPTYLLSETSFWRKVSTMVSKSFTLEVVVSSGSASGDDPSGPLSAASLSRLTSAMLKLNRQNALAPAAPPNGTSDWRRGLPVTEPDGAGRSSGLRPQSL